MHKKVIVCYILIVCSLLHITTFAQQTKESKKAIDAFISATTKSTFESTPVSETEIWVELTPGPRGRCVTRNDGAFGINFSNIEEMQGKESQIINLVISVRPKNNFPFKVSNNVFPFTLMKSEGPYYEFTLKFVKDNNTIDTGRFEIERNYQVNGPPKGGAKQKEGSAVKTGDSYQGEVMHF